MKHSHSIFSAALLVVLVATSAVPGGSASASHSAQAVAWPASQAIDLTSAATQQNPAIAVDSSGNAYVAWEDYRNGNADIYFSQRSAGGTWSAPVKLNNDGTVRNQVLPDIAVGGSYIYVVWEDYRSSIDADVYSTRRLTSGGAWEANKRVDQDRVDLPGDDINDQRYPRVCVDTGGNAYAVWQDKRNGWKKAYYGQRFTGDADWSFSEKITRGEGTTPTDPNEQLRPDIACYGNNSLRYAIWEDHRSDNSNVFYLERHNDGGWYPDLLGVKVVDDTLKKDQDIPAIAFDNSGKAWSVWLDFRTGAAQIWTSYYPLGGSWSANFQVSNAGAWNSADAHPRITVARNTGRPHVVWIDTASHVAYTYWSGAAWAAQSLVSDNNAATHLAPDIDSDNLGFLYVVWSDSRSGNPHIYFTSNSIPLANASFMETWPGVGWDDSRIYLHLKIQNSELSTRRITTTVQLPNDLYFPSFALSTLPPTNWMDLAPHVLTFTAQISGNTYFDLPWLPIQISTAITLPTTLTWTGVVTDNVATSTNGKTLSARVILNPLQYYLPIVFKK